MRFASFSPHGRFCKKKMRGSAKWGNYEIFSFVGFAYWKAAAPLQSH